MFEYWIILSNKFPTSYHSLKRKPYLKILNIKNLFWTVYLLSCTILELHTILQYHFILWHFFIFPNIELIPINLQFHTFLLRAIIFLPTFHYFNTSLFAYFLTRFLHRKQLCFSVWKRLFKNYLKKFFKISKQWKLVVKISPLKNWDP